MIDLQCMITYTYDLIVASIKEGPQLEIICRSAAQWCFRGHWWPMLALFWVLSCARGPKGDKISNVDTCSEAAERGLWYCAFFVFAGFGLAVSTKAKVKERKKQVLQSKNMRKHISYMTEDQENSEHTHISRYWGGGGHQIRCFPTSGVPDNTDDFSHDLNADFRLWRWWGDSSSPHLQLCPVDSPQPRSAALGWQRPQSHRYPTWSQKIQPLCLQMHF